MAKRTSKKKDVNQDAGGVAVEVAGEVNPKTGGPDAMEESGKALRSRVASILGKLGGSKGRKADSPNAVPEKRRQIAQNAAVARWTAKSK